MAASKSLYLISDRRLLGDSPGACDRLVELCASAAAAGVDRIQVRERDLPVREIIRIIRAIRNRVAAFATHVLVSDRSDVALAAGADGVHLTTRSIPPAAVRDATPGGFVIGVSTHNQTELEEAESGGADFAVCGPIFDTPSKREFGRPLGATEVARLAGLVRLPVLSVGGISGANACEASPSPVAGIAAIRMFHDAWLRNGDEGLRALVADLRKTI